MSKYMDEYKAELEQLIGNASPEALKICRAWHENFGVPQWGGVDFVRGELWKAQAAVDALNRPEEVPPGVMEHQRESRATAAGKFLGFLRHPLRLMSIPEREEAYETAEKYKLTAKDLLDVALKRAKDA